MDIGTNEVILQEGKRTIKRLEKARDIIRERKDLLRIDDTDVWIAEVICEEELSAIAELIDSIIEKEILRSEIAVYMAERRMNEGCHSC